MDRSVRGLQGAGEWPTAEMLGTIEGMRDELRRPMMLIIAARKR